MTQSPATPPVCDARDIEIARLRTAFRVNMMRFGAPDSEINKILGDASAPPPAADEARILAVWLKEQADQGGDEDVAERNWNRKLARAAALLSRIPSEEATEEGWQPIENAPKDGQIFFAYWGDVPTFCFAEPDGKTFRVATLTRDGKFGVHGNYAPFVPKEWHPLPLPARITRAPGAVV